MWRILAQHLFTLLRCALCSQRQVGSASARGHRSPTQRSSQEWPWDPSLASSLSSWTLRWGLVCLCGWGGEPTHRKGQIRITKQWSGACCVCVCVRVCIENPPGYFVAAAASQIVQTVGVMWSDFGSHRISWVVCLLQWFCFFFLREMCRVPATRLELCV